MSSPQSSSRLTTCRCETIEECSDVLNRVLVERVTPSGTISVERMYETAQQVAQECDLPVGDVLVTFERRYVD
jgi:hypothetical protein